MSLHVARLAAVSLLLLGRCITPISAEPPTLEQAADDLGAYQRTLEQNVGQFEPHINRISDSCDLSPYLASK